MNLITRIFARLYSKHIIISDSLIIVDNHFINQNQEAKLTFVVGPTAAPLLKNYKNIENIITTQLVSDTLIIHPIENQPGRESLIIMLKQRLLQMKERK